MKAFSAPPQTEAEARYRELEHHVQEQREAGDVLAAVDSAAAMHDAARKAFGNDDVRTVAAEEEYASTLLGVGRHAEALPMLQEVVRRLRERPGTPPTVLATSLSDLAVAFELCGKPDEAEPLYREALAIQTEASGPESSKTATVLHNLALLQQTLGHLDEAERLGQEALRIRERVLGPRHMLTIQSLNALAGTFLAKRELAVAEPLVRRAAALADELLPEDAPLVGETQQSLALIDMVHGNPEAALEHARRAATICEKTFGMQDPRTINAQWLLADVMAANGDIEQASVMHDELLHRTETTGGVDSELLAELLHRRALFLRQHGTPGKAAEVLERAITISKRLHGHDDRNTMALLAELAQLVGMDANPERCAAISRELLAYYEEQDGPSSIDVAATLNTLGLCESKVGHHDEARRAFERSVKIFDEQTGPASIRTLGAMFNLAQYHVGRKEFREAEAIVQDSFSRMRSEQNPAHMRLALLFIDLHAQLLRAQGRVEEAREAEKVLEDARREEQR